MTEIDTSKPAFRLSVPVGERAGSTLWVGNTPDGFRFDSVMADQTPGLAPGPKPGEFDTKKVAGLTCPENLDQPPSRLDKQVDSYSLDDAVHNVRHVPTVFFGSSTVANWTDLPRVFTDIGAINRGIGGSTLPDLTQDAESLVLTHTPERAVLYAGTNDIAEGHLPQKVFNDFVELEHTIHGTGGALKFPGASPDIKLYIIGMMPAPCREVLDDKYHLYEQTNMLIRDYAKRTPNVFYIDPSPAVDDKTGHIDRNEFGPDHLHPKPEVYTKLAGIIKDAIAADEYPNY